MIVLVAAALLLAGMASVCFFLCEIANELSEILDAMQGEDR